MMRKTTRMPGSGSSRSRTPTTGGQPPPAGSPTASLAGSQTQPGDAQTRAFYFRTGCQSTETTARFRALGERPRHQGRAYLFDRSVLAGGIALKLFVAHHPFWAPKPKEAAKNGAKSEGFRSKPHQTAVGRPQQYETRRGFAQTRHQGLPEAVFAPRPHLGKFKEREHGFDPGDLHPVGLCAETSRCLPPAPRP